MSTERYQVTCIHKSDRENMYKSIDSIGGKNSDGTSWSLTEEQAIQGILANKWSFYVSTGGKTVDVIVDEREGKKYLRTKPDGTTANNLLSLPECE